MAITWTFLCSNSLLLILILILPFLPFLPTIAISDCQYPIPNPDLTPLSTDALSSWNSSSGVFAFRFQYAPFNDSVPQPLLAIRFTKSPDQTVVWYAKPDRPVPVGSTANLTSDGIVIYDPQGKAMWQRPPPSQDNPMVSCASMQDDGNFVLRHKNGSIIWESFREPTDTLLPGQNFSQPVTLQARQSNTSFSNGNFNLSWQGDGNLVLYYSPNSGGQQQQRSPYWASGTNINESRLVFNEYGSMYIENGTAVTIENVMNGIPGSKEYYFMARIDPDGVFRLYRHLKEAVNNAAAAAGESCSSGWNDLESKPDDICLSFAMETGNVVCGFYSYCVSINGKPECMCPDHYSPFVQANDGNKNLTGCRPNFPLPSCQTGGWEEDQAQVDFNEYPNLDWPLSDYEHLTGDFDKDACREKCREDCFCAAAIYTNYTGQGECWKKRYPLSNGRKSLAVNRIAFVKFRKNDRDYGKQSPLTLVLAFLLGSSVFLNILSLFGFLGVFFFLRKRKLLGQQQVVTSLTSATVRSYTYKELEKATGGFKQVLGRGGYGTVYKGVLASDTTGRYVAVKKLDKVITEGDDNNEFKTEVNVIGQTHHRNLVRLLGYCEEGEHHRLLVYEYMSNGSLASFLFGISRPHWNQRVQIALGIAKGLTYLHEECSTQIIHCDIKPHNILLDELFTPRISDFGLAKLLLAEETRATRTGLRGTIGYFAPEWFSKASVTTKIDVYSFGVVLLEIICCKSSVAFGMANEEQALIDWAYDCYRLGKLVKLVENDEEARHDIKRVEKHVMVAIWCVQEDPSVRPSMKKVMQMLEDVTAISLPPRPSMFSSSSETSFV